MLLYTYTLSFEMNHNPLALPLSHDSAIHWLLFDASNLNRHLAAWIQEIASMP